MSEDPPTAAATYFDGVTSRRHTVAVQLGARELVLIENATPIATWPYADLRTVDRKGILRLSCASALPLARLDVRDGTLIEAILQRCGSLRHDPGAARIKTARIVGWSLAAIVSVVLVVVYGLPLLAERLTPLVPASLERRIGDAGDRQVRLMFGGRTCTGAPGRAALARLIDTLKRAGGMQTELQSEVLSSNIKNAFALAGGRVYVLDGLLQAAESVDELAGVLAHELGHASHRDHVRLMIYNGGTSFLIGLLFGDVTGSGAAVFATQALLTSSYSRGAETSADTFAITVMHALGRSPKPLGDFLFRLTQGRESRSLSILASHPLTSERRAAMTAADRPATGPELLSPREWQALKSICRTQ